MGPLIMIHAWVHLSASPQHPLLHGLGSPQDTASPLTRYRLFAWQEPRPMTRPHSPVSGVINFSSSVWWRERGSHDMQSWHQMMMAGWHMVTGPTSHHDPAEISAWHHWPLETQDDSRTPRVRIIFHRNWKWFLALPHSFYYPWLLSLLSPPPGVIQLVHNHSESHSPQRWDQERRK